jgi:hypothetical protein
VRRVSRRHTSDAYNSACLRPATENDRRRWIDRR